LQKYFAGRYPGKKGQAGVSVSADRICQALFHTPRHLFVPRYFAQQAYDDTVLDLPGPPRTATVSNPFIVAMLLTAVDTRNTDRSLEIGSDSGWVTTLLGELTESCVAIERIKAIAEFGAYNVGQAARNNTLMLWGDGYNGFSQRAPYDLIVVSAGAPYLAPNSLLDQLSPIGGRLVYPRACDPEGDPYFGHDLQLIVRSGDSFTVMESLSTRWVPMVPGVSVH
jgi:protein-L-isoaspartate(D-aspartate) O-methyltransferase